MKLFNRKKSAENVAFAQSADRQIYKLAPMYSSFEGEFYESLRAQVPILDACFGKIIRLTTGFKIVCENELAQKLVDRFAFDIPVGISGNSLNNFIDMYLDTLLTYGKALGEMSIDSEQRKICGLYIADPTLFRVKQGESPIDMRIVESFSGEEIDFSHPERLFYTTLNPSVKHPEGVSILRGIPALSSILMRIYECVGQNFDRVGNVRYSVNYRPSDDPSDRAFSKDRAMEIAHEWADGMTSSRCGVVKDFVSVGDVEIKVIGADNQILDTEIPVRQLLEQMLSKLSIPPFLLGLNWSSTERMSSQQSDILTSELEYYRRLIEPALRKIVSSFLQLNGFDDDYQIEWDNINLQDEEKLAKARYYNAQSEQLEIFNEKEFEVENGG